MADVNGVGPMDYSSMPIQANQLPEQYGMTADEMAGMPAYDPAEAEKGRSSSMGALGWLGLLGLSSALLFGGKYWGSRGTKAAEAELGKAKEVLNEIEKKADEVINERFGGFRKGKDLARLVKEKNKAFKEGAEEAVEKTEEVAEEAAKDISNKV